MRANRPHLSIHHPLGFSSEFQLLSQRCCLVTLACESRGASLGYQQNTGALLDASSQAWQPLRVFSSVQRHGGGGYGTAAAQTPNAPEPPPQPPEPPPQSPYCSKCSHLSDSSPFPIQVATDQMTVCVAFPHLSLLCPASLHLIQEYPEALVRTVLSPKPHTLGFWGLLIQGQSSALCLCGGMGPLTSSPNRVLSQCQDPVCILPPKSLTLDF